MSRSAPAPLENLTAKSRNAATGGKPVPAHHAQDSMTRAVGDMTRLIYSNIVDPTKKLAEAGLNLAQGPPTEVVDCIVIGAGLSGLSCADALLEKSPSLKVVVFDVNERVGGRTKTDSLAVAGRSLAVDCGGMWIGPMHTQMLHLCERFKIATVQQHDEGMHNLAAGPGVRASYVGDIPPHSWLSLLELQFRVIGHLDALAETVPLDNPAACPAAARLDAHSAASYFSRRLWTRDARDTIDLVALSLFGCHASQISMLYFLYYIRACGGVRALVDAKGGAQDRRLVGGTQQLCERLVEAVRNRAGDNVKVELGARVVAIRARAPGSEHPVLVMLHDGRRFASRVVVSAGIPSVVLRQVSFSPRLPCKLEQFAARTFRGAYAKAVLIYEAPWWRNNGFSGFCTNTRPDPQHVVSFCYDYCGMQEADDQGAPSAAALVCFFCGDAAVLAADQTPEDRRAAVVRSVQLMFGPELAPRAGHALAYHEYLWHRDEASNGCPVTIYPPGQFAGYNAQTLLGAPLALSKDSRPVIFFASTDISVEWCGYMEGAVRHGRAVALAVNRALNEQAHRRAPTSGKESFLVEDDWEVDETAQWVPAKGPGRAA